jgi:soluble lytic murein transglycosylase
MNRFVFLATAAVVLAAAFGAVYLAEPSWWQRLRYPLRYEQIVRGHAANYDLDPALLAAVIYQESKFEADARSRSGAIGLMQLLPATAQGIAVRTGGTRFRVDDLYDPELNVRYGAWYLRHLLDKYGDERLALAAYNAGQENVDRWLREGGVIRFAETRHYVDRVEGLKQVYRHAYGGRLGASQPSAAACSHRDVFVTLDKQQSDVIMTSRCSYGPTSTRSKPIWSQSPASATRASRRSPTA